jgi:hypothetical protein
MAAAFGLVSLRDQPAAFAGMMKAVLCERGKSENDLSLPHGLKPDG